jgi:hypothetical protein
MPTLRPFLRAYLGIDLVLQRDSGLAARLAHIERQQTDLLRQRSEVSAQPERQLIASPSDPTFTHDQSQTIREMADDIREMDQLVYQMSQCMSWESMRPYLTKLQAKATDRQKKESNRIGDIMRRELISVYTKGDPHQ